MYFHFLSHRKFISIKRESKIKEIKGYKNSIIRFNMFLLHYYANINIRRLSVQNWTMSCPCSCNTLTEK